MNYCSHITRSLRAVSAQLFLTALSFAALAGCQNNSERDLIARDRRMQENQIYALQDYIHQYQQLVCRYRSENAALREQLSEGYVVEPQRSEPQLTPRTRSSTPSTKSSPPFQAPRTPSTKEKQPDAPPPAAPIIEPEVPPLKSTTAHEPAATPEAEAKKSVSGESSPLVLTASYESPPTKPISPVSDEQSPPPTKGNAIDVMVCGEVVANDAGRGPRLTIDVVPFDKSGQVERFDGAVSLMLLDTDGERRQRNLGRWDYGPSDVRTAIDPKASDPTMRFYIELPAGIPIDKPAELWVRLAPAGGSKLLAHAKVELSRPGVFSSNTNKIWPAEESVVAASYNEPVPPAGDVVATVNEGSWSIAEPGKPANLPAEARDASSAGGWRVSSEPMAVPVAASSEPAPKSELGRPRRPIESSPLATTKKPATRPAWSAERSGESRNRVTTRPNWSAIR